MSGTSQHRQRETTTDLSGKLRAAEQRIKELEAKVRHHEDRADRAERWLYKIWVEVEQKFFGGDAVRLSQPPSTHSETR
jgi:chromosome segregation ATPase